MTRFTLPALGMLAALLLLFAGAIGEVPSWRHDVPAIITHSASTPPPQIQRVPNVQVQPAAASNGADPAQEARARIARENQELAAIRASAEEARRDLVTLREQREREQANLVRIQTAQNPNVTGGPPAASAPSVQTAAVAATRPVAAPAAIDPARMVTASSIGTGTEQVARQQHLLATRRLRAARTALNSGRRARARWLLTITQTQMAQWEPHAGIVDRGTADMGTAKPGAAIPRVAASGPTTPASSDQPPESPMKGVEEALNLLNRGDRDGAVRAIDQVLEMVSEETVEPPHHTN